jgi:hypothetical protein
VCSVRWRSLTGLAIALIATPPAAASDVELGAPSALRTAKAADLRAKPGATYEEWLVRAVDPATLTVLTINIVRDPQDDTVLGSAAVVPVAQAHVDTSFSWDPALGGPPTWRGPATAVTLVRDHGGWTLTAAGPALEGRLRISDARPGGVAGRWRFGTEADKGERHLSWAEPVATGLADGSLAVREWDEHANVELRRWRITIEHWWGNFTRKSDTYFGWQTYVVHQRNGVTWSLVGANRADIVGGPGAVAARWFGVLVRTDRRGTTLCRPRIQRRSPTVTADGRPVQAAVRARCGRRSVTIEGVARSDYERTAPLFGIGEGARVSAHGGVGYVRGISPSLG